MDVQQLDRLAIASTLRKYGHLETWEELYNYQWIALHNHDIISVQKIADFAHRKVNGESVTLPLMNYQPPVTITQTEVAL